MVDGLYSTTNGRVWFFSLAGCHYYYVIIIIYTARRAIVTKYFSSCKLLSNYALCSRRARLKYQYRVYLILYKWWLVYSMGTFRLRKCTLWYFDQVGNIMCVCGVEFIGETLTLGKIKLFCFCEIEFLENFEHGSISTFQKKKNFQFCELKSGRN